MSQHVTFDDWLMKRLAQDAEAAAALLRVALEKVDEDPRGLSLTLHYVTTAHGNRRPSESLSHLINNLDAW